MVFRFSLQHRLGMDGFSFTRISQIAVCPVAVHGIGFDVIMEIQVQDSLDPFFMGLIFDGNHEFDPFVQIAGHPVGGGNEYIFPAIIIEIKEAAVFQISSYDAVDFDIITEAGYFRTEHADTTDDKLDFDASLRRFIEAGDDFLIKERVHLGDDQSFLPLPGPGRFLIDFFINPLTQIERSYGQFVPIWRIGITGQEVEEGRSIDADQRVGSQNTDIRIDAGRLAVVASIRMSVF